MRYIALLLMMIATSTACNLSTTAPIPTPDIPDPPVLPPTSTLTASTTLPTLLPLPNLPATRLPVTSVPSLGALCQVYITYSGTRADNTLSLRADPSPASPQLFRVPNNTEVWRVPNSQEIAAEGYNWLHVIYEADPQQRYQGWIARDSYEVSGVRDPSIATLRDAGTQSPC